MLVFTRARLGALSLKKITASAKDAASYALYGTNNRLLAELTSRVLQVAHLATARTYRALRRKRDHKWAIPGDFPSCEIIFRIGLWKGS